jgi:hypothetical protein
MLSIDPKIRCEVMGSFRRYLFLLHVFTFPLQIPRNRWLTSFFLSFFLSFAQGPARLRRYRHPGHTRRFGRDRSRRFVTCPRLVSYDRRTQIPILTHRSNFCPILPLPSPFSTPYPIFFRPSRSLSPRHHAQGPQHPTPNSFPDR